MANFSIDLPGRIRNFELPKNKPLLPLFESIVNSIYAIEDRQQKEKIEGLINIEIIREPQYIIKGVGIDSSINQITGFKVTDNGIGFDENNMQSFLQSDSTYRADKGGKGVGRFSWLKAFKSAHISSVFKDDGGWVQRDFDFTLDNLNINDSLTEAVGENNDNRTTIELQECYPQYKKNIPAKTETIASSIMHHCFIYLMSSTCPKITVRDEDSSVCINDIFEMKIRREAEIVRFDINGEEFSLLHAKIEDAALGNNKLYLFANERMVQEYNIEKNIVNLDKNIFAEKGYYYLGVLSGAYLDQNVGTNRTAFDISETEDDSSEITMPQIIKKTTDYIKKYLSEYLEEIEEKKSSRIRNYIKNDAPQYGHLMKYMPSEIEAIKPNLSDTKLDDELYRLKRKFDVDLKTENAEIIRTLDVGAEKLEVYKERFQTQFEKISEANKAALAEYVAHRKVIIELLQKGLQIDDSSKYSKESYIHNLIYPMRRTSDEIEFQAHNLWLIDERLAYCAYISSDIPFNNNPKEDRTDVMMLNCPVAVSDEENIGREYETIVILELKRPMRNDYRMEENPITQMLGYVDKLSSNKMTDKQGRVIHVGDNTQFYLYAVCDVTDSLRRTAETFDFIETPDKMGMYKYHEKKRAYIEILSFDKLINDAKKRNQILFDKLGI